MENLVTGKCFIFRVTLYSGIYYIHQVIYCLLAGVEFVFQLTVEKLYVQKWEVRKCMAYWRTCWACGLARAGGACDGEGIG